MAFSPCNEMWKLEALREKFFNNLKVEIVLILFNYLFFHCVMSGMVWIYTLEQVPSTEQGCNGANHLCPCLCLIWL